MNVLGIIPARGGSKSVPYKNIYPLQGKPLMDWSYESAKASDSMTRILCSTEDAKIEMHCRDIGLEVLLRPAELASDDSNVFLTVSHVIDTISTLEEKIYDAIFCIQPTSPFVLPEHFRCAVAMLEENTHLGSVQSITVIPHNHHAYNQRRISENGNLKFVYPQERARYYSKQLKPKYYAWGNIFLTRTQSLLAQKTLFADPIGCFEVDSFAAMDLDTLYDFTLAEALLAIKKML